MSEKEGTKRLTIHFYPGTKRTDLGTKRLGYETFCTLPDYCASDFCSLTMYWFSVCHFRCKELKPLVIWIWYQNIAISTIVRTSSHIKLYA